MTPKRLFPTLALTAACAAGVAPVASARAATDVQQASSGNWSGYVVGSSDSDETFKTVTGSWVQPKASCSTGSTYGAFWVGLGGASGATALEQDGTEVNCSAGGTASYYAWYELVPKAPVKVDLAVHPGDHMTATTTVNGHDVTETIVNDTTGQTFTKTLTMSDPDTSSAEWITEAPSQCEGSVENCSALPLTDFGSVKFSSASATDSSGHTGSISDASWETDALTLDSSESASMNPGAGYGSYQTGATSSSGSASPSSLSDGGTAFSVDYRRAAADTSTSSAGGDGSGYPSGYGSGYPSGYGSGYPSGYGYPGSSDGYGYSGSGDGYGYGGEGYGYSSGDGYGSAASTGNGGYIVVYTY